jgi:hypothetical protein
MYQILKKGRLIKTFKSLKKAREFIKDTNFVIRYNLEKKS